MHPSPSQTEPESPVEEAQGPHLPRDLIAGLVLLGISAFFLLAAGEGTLDWIFPGVLSYSVGILGIVLVVRGLLGLGDRVPAVPPVLRGAGVAVGVFVLIMVVYVVLIRPVGFWPVSVLMIFVTSLYLSPDRSRRSIAVSALTAAVVGVLAYLLLEFVFYVPFPRPRWLPL